MSTAFTVQPLYTIACWLLYTGSGPATFLTTPTLTYGIDGFQYIGSHLGNSFTLGGSLVANQWQHIVFTYDGTNLMFYVNGSFQNSIVPYPYAVASGPLNIAPQWAGSVDDVRVYDGTLTSSQILALYIYESNLSDPTLTSIPYTSPTISISFGSSSGSPTATDSGNYQITGSVAMSAVSRPNVFWPPKSLNVSTNAASYTSIIGGQTYGNGNYTMTASSFLDVAHNYTLPFQVPFSATDQWVTGINKYARDVDPNPGTYIGSVTTPMSYRFDYTYTGIIRTVLVPAGTWTFALTGGQGGDSSTTIASPGGFGATTTGTVVFAADTLLQYIIGGKGIAGGSHGGGGGGGASYVRTYVPAPPPQPTWGARISGTQNEVGQNITLDSTGNAYVTGYMNVTTPMATVYNASDVAATTFSTINGQTSTAYIVKYARDGATVPWTTQIAIGDVYPANIACLQVKTDSSDFLYATGYYKGAPTVYNADGSPYVPPVAIPAPSSGQYDTFIAKYSPSGVVQWVNHISGNQIDIPATHVLAADGTGVYVGVIFLGTISIVYPATGEVFTTVTGDSAQGSSCIIKYDAAGQPSWVRKLAGPGATFAMGMALDPSGGLYVTGTSNMPCVVYNTDGTTIFKTLSIGTGFIVKYSSVTGTPLWATQMSNPTSQSIVSVSATSSALFVVGLYTGTFTAYNQDDSAFGTTLANSGGNDVFIVKYNLLGVVQWVTRVAGTGSDTGTDVSTTADGVFVAGTMSTDTTIYNSDTSTFKTLTGSGSFLVKYNLTGAAVESFKLTSSVSNTLNAIAANASGNVYVTGSYAGNLTIYNSSDVSFGTLTNGGAQDTFVINYSAPSATGTLLFVAGGGGGAGPPGTNGNDARTDQFGTGLGGTQGNTGSGGGGGYSGDGDGGSSGGKSFLNGSAAGSGYSTENAAGGFGGGGSNYASYPYISGGGGGGYTGGNGGDAGLGGYGGGGYFIPTATNTSGRLNTGGGNGSLTLTSTTYTFAGEWIQINYPTPFVPNTFKAYEIGGRNAVAYKIGGSNDGTTWTLIYSGSASTLTVDGETTKNMTGVTKAYSYYRYVATQVGTTSSNGTFALGGLAYNIGAKGFYVPIFANDGPLTVSGFTPSAKNYTMATWISRTSGTSLFQQGTSDLLIGCAADNSFVGKHNGKSFSFSGLDPLWANKTNTIVTPFTATIVGLFHCQALSDSSQYVSTVTASGTAVISNAQSKFGGASLSFPTESGTPSYLRVTPTSNIFGFVTDDFTIDFWMYPLSSTIATRRIMGNSTTTEVDAYRWRMTFDSKHVGFYATNCSGFLQSSTTIATETWTHVALVRSGNNLTLFINGVIDTTAVVSGPVDNGGIQELIIGRASTGNATTEGFYGYMDEIRVVHGAAVYTAAFTPASAEYTTSVTLSKLATATNNWNASAITARSYTYSANVSAQANQTNGTMSIGFSETTTVPTTNPYLSQAYAWRMNYDGSLTIYENGTLIGTFGTYTTNDVLSITFEHGAVSYYNSGIIKRSVARTAGTPLYGLFTPYTIVNGGTIATTSGSALTYDGTDIYVADSTTNTIKKVIVATGVVSTLAAGFTGLSGITFVTAGAGNLYVTDTSAKTITQVSLTGTKTTIATALTGPTGITNDGAGNLYVIDGTTIKKVVIVGGTKSTIATGLTAPVGITFNGTYLYVTDSGLVKRVVITSGATTTFSSGYTTPAGITYDGNGSMYVTDTGAGTLTKLEIATAYKNTFTSGLVAPIGVVYNAGSNVYMTDSGTIKSIAFAGVPSVRNVTFDNYARASAGQWQHVIVTYTGDVNVASLYIDGNLESTIQVPAYTSTLNSLQIGTSWSGSLDDVRVYAGVMSASECGRLYAYESSLTGEALIIANPGYVQIASVVVTV